MPTDADPAVLRDAAAVAAEVARRAGIGIEPIESARQADDAADILRDIWGGDPTALPGNAIRALAHAGNYAVSVHDLAADGALIGASVAFFCAPARSAIHSHITGLRPAVRGRSIGTAVKLHQRAWALAVGLTTVTWTYDPLIARNAHFNLTTLGAAITSYEVDFYGPMQDEINLGDETDRFEVDWDLTRPWPVDPPTAGGTLVLEVGPSGEPLRLPGLAGGEPVEAGIPSDVEELRRADPALARQWRHALRDTLLPLLDDGYRVIGFTEQSRYLLAPPP